MRLFMILGMMILIIGFVIALFVAATAGSVYSNPVTAICYPIINYFGLTEIIPKR